MSLSLDLLRHGEAVSQDPAGDAGRRLSAYGEQTLAELGARLAAMAWRPDRVLTSPYRRAIDSARIVCRAVHGAPRAEILAELEPETDPGEALAALQRLGIEAGSVLVVAHQPLIGRLLERLTRRTAEFHPGTLVRLECPAGLEPGTASVVSTIQPGHHG